ncbi:Hypothetical protein, putative [Bodo saltans]|uniref:Uncharacterized protein n=1 Tax=Bodo saltans TaxID=75058 RepID=A0A0S4J367_BODSA|nr:Hypothetical protein, putative [Bodo saltans]|eukprot:CUG06669.1 Hypothetical protein, putative [Bodo saltans]
MFLSSLVRVRMGIPDATVEVVASSLSDVGNETSRTIEMALEPITICVSVARCRTSQKKQAGVNSNANNAQLEVALLTRALCKTIRTVLSPSEVSCSLIKLDETSTGLRFSHPHEPLWPASCITSSTNSTTTLLAKDEHPNDYDDSAAVDIPMEILIGPNDNSGPLAANIGTPLNHLQRWALFVPFAPTMNAALLLDRCDRAAHVVTLPNFGGWVIVFFNHNDLLWTFGGGVHSGVDFGAASVATPRITSNNGNGASPHRYFSFSPMSDLSPSRRDCRALRNDDDDLVGPLSEWMLIGASNNKRDNNLEQATPRALVWDVDGDGDEMTKSDAASAAPLFSSSLLMEEDRTSVTAASIGLSSRHRSCIDASLHYYTPEDPPQTGRNVRSAAPLLHPMLLLNYRIVVSIVFEDDKEESNDDQDEYVRNGSETLVEGALRRSLPFAVATNFVRKHTTFPMILKRQIMFGALLRQWVMVASTQLSGPQDGSCQGVVVSAQPSIEHVTPRRGFMNPCPSEASTNRVAEVLVNVLRTFRELSSMKRVHGPGGRSAASRSFSITLFDDIICMMAACAMERVGVLQELSSQWFTSLSALPPGQESVMNDNNYKPVLVRYVIHRVASYYYHHHHHHHHLVASMANSNNARNGKVDPELLPIDSHKHFTWGNDRALTFSLTAAQQQQLQQQQNSDDNNHTVRSSEASSKDHFEIRLLGTTTTTTTTLVRLPWNSGGITELFLFFKEVSEALNPVATSVPIGSLGLRWERWMMQIEIARCRGFSKCATCTRVADSCAISIISQSRARSSDDDVVNPHRRRWLCRRCEYAETQKTKDERHRCLSDALRLSRSMKLNLTADALSLARRRE